MLHGGEEQLYMKSREVISTQKDLQLCVYALESTLDLLNSFRLIIVKDDDYKLIQVLAIRLFNDFASSFKLMMSGYYQVGGMGLRDALETIFLIDFFSSNLKAVSVWRNATSKERKTQFKPVKIREALDKRDGLTNFKRAQAYEMLSELATHPTMWGFSMLQPKGGDIHMGPFVDPTALKASLEELSKLVMQGGEVICRFIPPETQTSFSSFEDFMKIKNIWLREFYKTS